MDAPAVAEYSRLVWERGWVANHDGNLTVRRGDGSLLATPTAVSKRRIGAGDVLHLDAAGKLLDGTGKPFSELVLHLAAYRARPDARAVIHAHPPTAAGLSMAGVEVDPTVTPEAVVSLGDRIPLVPHFLPGDPRLPDALGVALADADVVVLRGHGVLSLGDDLEQAYLRLELAEHLARMLLVARQAGRLDRLPRGEVEQLLKKRAAAGLGREGRRQRAAALPAGAGSGTGTGDDLATLIAAEVKAALRG
jgi:L-fuculose-phosphate aldolase